jgi:hypothetical protein
MSDDRRYRPDLPGTSRRSVLRGLGAVGVAGVLAGCSTGVDDEPVPRVVKHEFEPDFRTLAQNTEITVSALVANHGQDGEIDVVARTRPEGVEEFLDTHTETITLKASGQERIEFEMDVSASADILVVEAEPA